jgi:hypothetical protein
METVLLEAFCRVCDLAYDLWAETSNDGQTFQIDGRHIHCPNCLTPVAARDIKPKESLA